MDGGLALEIPSITEAQDFWQAEPRFRNRYLGGAKLAIKEHSLDIQVLKVALRRMKAQGIQPKDILLPCKWRASGGDTYYDAILREKASAPPVYDRIALAEWARTWEQDGTIEDFDL